MLALEVYHHKTLVKNANKDDFELVKKALTVFKKNFIASPTQDLWEIIYLLNYKDFSFPTAYLDSLKEYCFEHNIYLHIEDKRKYKPQYLNRLIIKKNLELRIDQKEAYNEIKNNDTGIIMMPTATGKSRVILKALEFRKVRTLIIVPRTNLQHAMVENIKKWFGPSRVDDKIPLELVEKLKRGLIESEEDVKNGFNPYQKESSISDFLVKADDKKDSKSKNSSLDEFKKDSSQSKITKSSSIDDFRKEEKTEDPEDAFLKDKRQKAFEKKIQKSKEKEKNKLNAPVKYKDVYVICDMSLPNLPQAFFDQFEMVIIDECHHSAGAMIREALLKLKNACYRYYFSATPWRDNSAEQKLLASAIGTKIIYEISPQRAIELGSIAKPNYIQKNVAQHEKNISFLKKWREILEIGIIGNKTRNRQIVDDAIKEFNQGKNVFINVDEISHIELLKSRFESLNIPVDIIHGQLPRRENLKTIEKVGNRQTGICLGTMSVGEGTDMPNLDTIILASGGKSSIRLIQRIGRGARLGTELSKKNFDVIDYNDIFHSTLARHAYKRKTIYLNYFKDWGE